MELRDTGGDGPAVLFLHGALVDGTLWDRVVERLPDHRCLVPTLPLGSHTPPVADRSRADAAGRRAIDRRSARRRWICAT